MDIIGKLKDLGYTTINSEWYSRVEAWNSWYAGNVKDFHVYTVWNGQAWVDCKRYSLGMAKKICEDWANLLMNEKVKITLEGDKEQDFIDEVFAENNFEVNANELQEKCAARGTYAIIPRVSGRVTDGKVDGKIILDYITADRIFPLAWNGREITQCAFSAVIKQEDKTYIYLQLHVLEGEEYVIKNLFYDSAEGGMNDVPASQIEGYQYVPEVVRTHSDKPQFVIGRFNIANNVDELNPMGIPVYANAIDILKGVDIAYDSYVNEFVLGKKRVMVQPSATKKMDGQDVFDPNDVTYYVLPEDVKDGSLIQPIDMSLRTADHKQGLQDQLNLLSAKCGFGEEHYKFDQGSIATATQIISENSEMFRTIKKHEIVLESVLIQLCRILLRVANNYLSRGLDEDVEISVDFDDSIIEDKNTDFMRDLQLLSAGILNDWEFRMRWMNEDEETAKAALPKMQALVTEGQDEVE